ncbi:MAG: hypothetical protein LBW85_10065 [Deltaproteobacteria bacterium]|nr:hypothetical protein [Deltaproteobacteria bacterium]
MTEEPEIEEPAVEEPEIEASAMEEQAVEEPEIEAPAIELYCPVQEVKITVGSKLLDDMGQFSKFILSAAGEGHTAKEVSETIEIKEYVVNDEMNYLRSIGFIQDGSDGKQLISESGKSYLNLIACVSGFNGKEVKAQLNCYTGMITELNPRRKRELNANDTVLPSQVNRYLVHNRNFENSKDYVISAYEGDFRGLNKTQEDSIYVNVEVEDTRTVDHVKYVLETLPELADREGDPHPKHHVICLERELNEYRRVYRNASLEAYRNVLPTLRNVLDFDDTLLSDAAKRLLRLEEAENLINGKAGTIVIDAATGEEVPEMPRYRLEARKTTALPAGPGRAAPEPAQAQADDSAGDERIVYVLTLEKLRTHVLLQPVDFTRFREAKGDE